MNDPIIKFYDWAPSPFCFKVRAILEYKSIAYERIRPHGRALLRIHRRGKIGKVPALEIDRELIVDSTDIVYALEARFPDPPVIPSSPKERALCHALEEWADESLYFIGLYFQWHELEGRKMVPQVFGKGILGQLAYWKYLWLILKQLKGQGTSRKPPAHVRADLTRQIEAIEALLQPGPFLLGDKPYLCDFALLGQIAYLARTPVGGQALKLRAIDAFRARMKALRPVEPPT